LRRIIAEKCKAYKSNPWGGDFRPASGPTKKEIAMSWPLANKPRTLIKSSKLCPRKWENFTVEENQGDVI